MEIPLHIWNRVPEGWYGFDIPEEIVPLVVEFDEKLSKIAPDYEIYQIKEKFHTLRIYVEYNAPEFTDEQWDRANNIVDEYEKKGTHILQRIYREMRKSEEARRNH